MMNFNKMPLILSKEVEEGLKNNQPVIALESSVIAQGLPYPSNIETALKLENTAKNLGVIPATVALIKGKIKIGLTPEEIELLATEKNVFKVSKRDIAPVLAKNGNGGTTVAATCFISSLIGIKVFATGGIGGVHGGEEHAFDISADLPELSRSKTTVVSAGPKSIIDLKLTLEYLETMSVPVIGYKTDFCPHFFINSRECPVSFRADSPEEIAGIINQKEEMGIDGGILVVNPLMEDKCLNSEEYWKAYSEATEEAKEKNIRGNKVTPFLLGKINEITKGKSKEANLLLLENNVRLASEIAIALKR